MKEIPTQNVLTFRCFPQSCVNPKRAHADRGKLQGDMNIITSAMNETGLRCPDSQDLGFYSLECRNITKSNRKSPSSSIHGFTFCFTVVVFLSLSTFGPSGCVMRGAGDVARERGQTSSHTNSSSAFLHLASFSLVWQSNRIRVRIRRTKKNLVCLRCSVVLNRSRELLHFSAGLLFGLSDTQSRVIYFCIVDGHDLQTVSHCYFTWSSCQGLVVTGGGWRGLAGCSRCHKLETFVGFLYRTA